MSFIAPPAILRRMEAMDDTVSTADVMWMIAIMFGYMICLVHAITLAGFSAFHTYLVLKNRTTIESNEPRQAQHAEILRRLDQTPLQHWRSVFGHTPLLWFIPVTLGRDGDGVHWRRIEDVV